MIDFEMECSSCGKTSDMLFACGTPHEEVGCRKLICESCINGWVSTLEPPFRRFPLCPSCSQDLVNLMLLQAAADKSSQDN